MRKRRDSWRSRTCGLAAAVLVACAAAPGEAAVPVTVKVEPGPAGSVRAIIRVPTGQEPVLAWAGAKGQGPYPLALIWTDANLALDPDAAVLPRAGAGPLQSIALRSVGNSDRLELQLRQPVFPKLRRSGSTWILQLDPAPAPAAPVAAAPPPGAITGPAAAAPAAPMPTVPPPAAPAPAAPALAPPRPPAPAPALGTSEPLLADFTVNGLRQADIARAEQRADGTVLVASESWSAARLAPAGQPLPMSDGGKGYLLDAVPGVRYTVDKQRMSIDVQAPPAAFVTAKVDGGEGTDAAPPRPPSGAFVNYDASVTRPADGAPSTTAATLEAVGFGPFGTAVTSALVSDDGVDRRAVRLDSYWQYDMPDRMQTLVVGDTIGVAGGWSRPVRYAGLRWGRDFGLRPGFVTMPLPSVSGQAALPSTVDLLVNGSQRLTQSVRPGPFDITNVPVITGSGELNLVVHDLLGRQTVVSQSYYASPQLIARGLTDFSFEAGRLRTGYGIDSQYGDAFGAATVRRGLSSSVTAEARAEAQANRQAAGADVASLLGTWGVASAAVAASRDQLHGAPETGQLFEVGVERRTPMGGGSVQYQYATRGFAPFGESASPDAPALRSREQLFASLGGHLWGTWSGGINYVRRLTWNGDRASALGLSLSVPLAGGASLTFSGSRRFDDTHPWTGTVSLNVPLQADTYVGAHVDRQDDGHTSATAFAVRNPPAGPGLGWRVETSTEPSQRARAGGQYNASFAEMTGQAVTDAAGRVSARAGARGSVGFMSGVPFASRPIGDGSFAVVQVDGVPDIPIKRSNQVVARTDPRGFAFVPGLVPWNRNRIEIDAADLPLDVEIGDVVQDVVPYARSGTLVHFDARRSRQALLVLAQKNGEPIPVGARVQLLGTAAEFTAGRRGEVWLTDLSGNRLRVRASWGQHACEVTVDLPAAKDSNPVKLGPLACGAPAP